MRPWRKVLYIRQDYPDNYVDTTSFLHSLTKNLNVSPQPYVQLLLATLAISQQFACLLLFTAVFIHLDLGLCSYKELVPSTFASALLFWLIYRGLWAMGRGRASAETSENASPRPETIQSPPPTSPVTKDITQPNRDDQFHSIRSRLRFSRTCCLLFSLLFGLSPMIKSLTREISSDTLYALVTLCFIVNMTCHDYSHAISTIVKFPNSLSVNAAIFASVLLASRLGSSLDVFALMTFAVFIFPLFSLLRRSIQRMDNTVHCALTVLLSAVSARLLSKVVAAEVVWMAMLTLTFISFGVPAWMVLGQRLKHEVRGPWDEARIQSRTSTGSGGGVPSSS